MPPSTPRAVARALADSIAVILLLIPVIVLNVVETATSKFIAIMAAASAFVSALTVTSLAGMTEVLWQGLRTPLRW